jgi:hypothetical protein
MADTRVGGPPSANRKNGRAHPADRPIITGSCRVTITIEIVSPLHRVSCGFGAAAAVVVSCASAELPPIAIARAAVDAYRRCTGAVGVISAPR